MFSIHDVFVAAAVVVTVPFVTSCVYQVKEKTAAIVEIFGKYAYTMGAGFNFKLPYPISRIANVEDLRLRQVDFTAEVNTADNAFAQIPISLHYHVTNPKDAYYELQNHEKQMVSFALNEVRSKGADMDMAELFKSSDAIKKAITAALEEKVGKYGFKIEDVVVATAKPSEEVRTAFNKVIASTRLMEAAQNEGEAAKIKTVKAAEAEAAAMALYGKGIADQRIAIAKGSEEAMREMEKSGLTPQQAAAVMLITNGQEAVVKASANEGTVIVSTTNAGAISGDVADFMAKFEALGRPANNVRSKTSTTLDAA